VGEALSKKLAERVAYFQLEYEKKIALKKAKLAQLELDRQSSKWLVKDFEKRIDELRSEIKSVRKSIKALVKERDSFLSAADDDGKAASALLFTNTIHQNIAMENSYRMEINDYVSRHEVEKHRLAKLDIKAMLLLEEIDQLKSDKNSVKNILILQSPTSSGKAVKPKAKMNIMLAFVGGLFFTTLFAFFLEYIQRHRKRPRISESPIE
jgi:capsular polysaccharide biosynthesis protein